MPAGCSIGDPEWEREKADLLKQIFQRTEEVDQTAASVASTLDDIKRVEERVKTTQEFMELDNPTTKSGHSKGKGPGTKKGA